MVNGESMADFASFIAACASLSRYPSAINPASTSAIIMPSLPLSVSSGNEGAKPDVSPKCLILSFNSTINRCAVFLPTPGIRVNASSSLFITNWCNSCTVTVDIIANAIFAPTPLTLSNSLNTSRSLWLKNPNNN